MLKLLYSFIFFLFFISGVQSQCNLDFGTTVGDFTFATPYGPYIVNGASGANDSNTQSFDIWDEANLDCTTAGGANDITFDFEILHATDVYSVDGIIDAFAGNKHDIIQTTSGLGGNIPLGDSGHSESSTADRRGYRIKVSFASHVNVFASDLTVNMTGINPAAEAFISTSIVFFDKTGTDFGSATYDGFYDSSAAPAGATTDNTCTAPAPTSPWLTSGTGVFVAASTGTVDMTDPCNPVAGTAGSDNNKNVNAATDAGLAATQLVGGFTFTVYAEDVAASASSWANTSTNVLISSTLNGVSIANNPLPVELLGFRATADKNDVHIDWLTGDEQQNDYFELQHSRDGASFATLIRKKGAGTSSGIHNYQYIHEDVSKGTHYYRLRQVDFDGNSSLSRVIVIVLEAIDVPVLYPTTAHASVAIILPEGNKYKYYELLNFSGQLISTHQFDNTAFEIEVSVESLAAGQYMIRLLGREEPAILPFTKANR